MFLLTDVKVLNLKEVREVSLDVDMITFEWGDGKSVTHYFGVDAEDVFKRISVVLASGHPTEVIDCRNLDDRE